MTALRSPSEVRTELEVGPYDSVAADAFIRLASTEDKAVPSPASELQAGLEAGLASGSSIARWPVGGVLLVLLATGGLMWGALIGGVLVFVHK
jgi:hypothetical protein